MVYGGFTQPYSLDKVFVMWVLYAGYQLKNLKCTTRILTAKNIF